MVRPPKLIKTTRTRMETTRKGRFQMKHKGSFPQSVLGKNVLRANNGPYVHFCIEWDVYYEEALDVSTSQHSKYTKTDDHQEA